MQTLTACIHPIMAEQLSYLQPGFNFLNFGNSDHIYFIKEIKKLVPHALLSLYISTQEFLRTLEKCKKHSLSARACLLFSRVLRNSCVLV